MMRRRGTLSQQYFEELYGTSPDPWDFASSEYEHTKYQATLAAIGSGYQSALEIGCSIGVFTRRLAERCSRLLAVDIAAGALQQARERCADLPHVEFQQLALPRELPNGCFDLIVLSEVGYYWTLDDLDRFIAWIPRALATGGLCALVHWTGETDYPLTGDEVHDRFIETTREFLRLRVSARNPSYRLDALAKD
jgi:SAM-dependent methyltransferase